MFNVCCSETDPITYLNLLNSLHAVKFVIIFSCLLSDFFKADLKFFVKILSGILSGCSWDLDQADILSGLIWVQIVCKDHRFK